MIICDKENSMNVFISYSHADNEFACKLSYILESDGYDVFIDNKIPIGNNIYKDIGKGIAKADVVIVIISNDSINSNFVANETVSMLSFLDKSRMPLVIPIVLGKETALPIELNRFNCIVIPYENEKTNSSNENQKYQKSLDKNIEKDAIDKVRLILAAHDEKLKEYNQEQKETEEKVKQGLSKYIDDVFIKLQEKEKSNKIASIWLYAVSILFLISTIIIALVFSSTIKIDSDNVLPVIVSGIVCLVIIVMLISLSKLLFTLAKSFMVESIRCSDRIHAISFGKFFLDAYGTEASREEVIKAFSSWNIDNGSTLFRNQSSDDFDPKLVEILKTLRK